MLVYRRVIVYECLFGNVEYVCLTPNYVDFLTMRFWTDLRPLVSMLETIIPISPIIRQDLMVTSPYQTTNEFWGAMYFRVFLKAMSYLFFLLITVPLSRKCCPVSGSMSFISIV